MTFRRRQLQPGRFGGLPMAEQGAGNVPVEGFTRPLKMLAQPAGLFEAELGELVVVRGAEGCLPVPYQDEFSHSPGLYGTIAA